MKESVFLYWSYIVVAQIQVGQIFQTNKSISTDCFNIVAWQIKLHQVVQATENPVVGIFYYPPYTIVVQVSAIANQILLQRINNRRRCENTYSTFKFGKCTKAFSPILDISLLLRNSFCKCDKPMKVSTSIVCILLKDKSLEKINTTFQYTLILWHVFEFRIWDKL